VAEEIDFEKCNFQNFRRPATLTLTLNRVIRHTIMHHSSTSMYTPNFIEIGQTFCRRTDGRTYLLTDGHLPPLMLLGRLGGDDLTMMVYWWVWMVSAYGWTQPLLVGLVWASAATWHWVSIHQMNPVNSWHKDATVTIVTGIRIIITITINSKQVPHATTGQFSADAI